MNSTPQPTLASRIRGALYGSLVGDALGVPVEFSTRAERDADPVVGMRAWGTHHQPAGTWSDDGALVLARQKAFVSIFPKIGSVHSMCAG